MKNRFTFTGVLHAALESVSLFLLTLPSVYAVPVSNFDLFLPPSQISDGFYDTHLLTFGFATTVSQVYTIADIASSGDVSGKLLQVRILPVLNPNLAPTSVEGEYTVSELENITASNYSQYFLRQPGADYVADLTPELIRVDYRASGQYFVAIDADIGGQLFTRVFLDQVDDFFIQDPPKAPKEKAGVSRKIPVPSADLYLVSTEDPAYDDKGALDIAASIYKQEKKNVIRVDSLDAVKKEIEKAFKANGNRKVRVVLDGHGRGLPYGSIKIGTERINNDSDGTMTPKDFQSLIDDWTESIDFYSCDTGQDEAFVNAFGASINSVLAFSVPVTASAPSFFGLFSGYFDTGATATRVTVPEPGTVALLIVGVVALLMLNFGQVRRGISAPGPQ